jgi:hypothetical protein
MHGHALSTWCECWQIPPQRHSCAHTTTTASRLRPTFSSVNSSAPRTSVGFAYVRVGVDQHSRMLRLPILSSADGNKAALATRLAQLFGPQYVSPSDPAVGHQLRRRAAAVVHDDEFMYDLADDDDARTTHLSAKLMHEMGPVSAWGPLQRDEDCSAAHRVIRADGVMFYDSGDEQAGVVCFGHGSSIWCMSSSGTTSTVSWPSSNEPSTGPQ